MEFYKQYPSGLRLVAKKTENCYTVSLGVYVDVGCVKESEKENGYSHFIEHMFFKGTKRRSARQISEEMDDIGANLNAFTSKDCTCYYTKSVSSDLEKCVDLLSDLYFFSEFAEEELKREKSVVIEEINMSEDTPDDVSQDAISAALFKNQPLGQTILGFPDNIKYCDRHSIKNYKEKHYIPSNTVISVAGNFDFAKLDKLVENYFETHFERMVAVLPETEPKVTYTSEFVHRFKDIEQCHLEVAVGGCALNSSDRYALSILSGILGGATSSRLFQTIREKHGLVYSVYSYPSFYSNCGMLEIYAALSGSNIEKYCDLLEAELNEFLDKGVTQQELVRAQVQAVNGLYMSLENNMTLMRLFGRCLLKTGTVYNAENEVEKYRAVTVREVNDLARRLFSQSFASSYVGKQHKSFDKISQLHI